MLKFRVEKVTVSETIEIGSQNLGSKPYPICVFVYKVYPFLFSSNTVN